MSFQSPASALSAVLVLPRGRQDGNDSVTLINRNGSSTAYDDAIVGVDRARTGEYEARVTFFAGRDGSGSVMAVGGARVRLNANGELTKQDGSPLGSVKAEGRVAKISWVGQETLIAGQPSLNSFFVQDSNGQLLGVSPGSVFLTRRSGTMNVTLTDELRLKSDRAGTATIQVTVDGVSSPELDVRAVAVQRFKVANDALELTPDRKLLALQGAANRIVVIDPNTGATLRTFTLGGVPNTMALSKDGSLLYVGLSGLPSYQVITMSSGSVSLLKPLKDTGYGASQILDLDVHPTDPTVFACTVSSVSNSGYGFATVYKNGVALPTDFGLYTGTEIEFATPTLVVLQDRGSSSGETSQGTYNSTRLKRTKVVNTLATGRLTEMGGICYSAGGAAFHPSTFQLLRTVPPCTSLHLCPSANKGFAISGESSGSFEIRSFVKSTGVALDIVTLNLGLTGYFPAYQSPQTALDAHKVVLGGGEEIVIVTGL